MYKLDVVKCEMQSLSDYIQDVGEFSLSFQWLKCDHLKMHTETQVVAAQDQALAVRAAQNLIYGMSVALNECAA